MGGEERTGEDAEGREGKGSFKQEKEGGGREEGRKGEEGVRLRPKEEKEGGEAPGGGD